MSKLPHTRAKIALSDFFGKIVPGSPDALSISYFYENDGCFIFMLKYLFSKRYVFFFSIYLHFEYLDRLRLHSPRQRFVCNIFTRIVFFFSSNCSKTIMTKNWYSRYVQEIQQKLRRTTLRYDRHNYN